MCFHLNVFLNRKRKRKGRRNENWEFRKNSGDDDDNNNNQKKMDNFENGQTKQRKRDEFVYISGERETEIKYEHKTHVFIYK